MSETLEALVIRKTSRVPRPDGPTGDGTVAARQFDAALMSAGFKCSRGLLECLSGMDTGVVIDTAVKTLAVVREMVGDHVRHNAYFKDFPYNVPDTLDFWYELLCQAMLDPVAAQAVEVTVGAHPFSGRDLTGGVNLLSLPGYGTYQHTWEELLAAHDEFLPAAGDRVTVLHLGESLDEEAHGLYLSLAGTRTPLNEADMGALSLLAAMYTGWQQPETVPVREARAVVNAARLAKGAPLLADTLTDVLRLAAAVSDGDVGLVKPARLRSLRRPERRVMLAALHQVVTANPAKLGDVARHREQWKRLGERLHPHEYPAWPGAQRVFAVARGEDHVPSFAALVEAEFAQGHPGRAAMLLGNAPGMLLRSADRLLRATPAKPALLYAGPSHQAQVVEAVTRALPGASGRVLLSLREHLQNRTSPADVARVFVNRHGRAWVTPDTREPLEDAAAGDMLAAVDTEAASRLPAVEHLVVDPDVLTVALPLSEKTVPAGFGVLPRGSLTEVDGGVLRFFVYWKQRAQRTDYDLSAVLLNSDFTYAGQVSWTNYHSGGYATYSGDITDATNGATEFIDIDLPRAPQGFVVPQVNIFCGERFGEVEEAFFGFMLRDPAQKGMPFEPAAVRMKSDLRGDGRVALPLAFTKAGDGKWRAKWLHLYLRGHAVFNQAEGNRLSTSLLARSIMGRDHLKVVYLVDMLHARATTVTVAAAPELASDSAGPVTYVGLSRPEGLPKNAAVYTLGNLRELIPA